MPCMASQLVRGSCQQRVPQFPWHRGRDLGASILKIHGRNGGREERDRKKDRDGRRENEEEEKYWNQDRGGHSRAMERRAFTG